jgi:hypothetical protein
MAAGFAHGSIPQTKTSQHEVSRKQSNHQRHGDSRCSLRELGNTFGSRSEPRLLGCVKNELIICPFIDETHERIMRLGAEPAGIEFYYSLVTMTTLGYGDIIPVTPASRSLATLQAVVGQLQSQITNIGSIFSICRFLILDRIARFGNTGFTTITCYWAATPRETKRDPITFYVGGRATKRLFSFEHTARC